MEIPDERMGRGGVNNAKLDKQPSYGRIRREPGLGDGHLLGGKSQPGGRPGLVQTPNENGDETTGKRNLAPSPLPGWPKPTDKWNYAYAQYLELEKQAGRVKWWWYEPLPWGITLGGAEDKKKYKPDFLVWYPDGLERRLEFVEVKGFSKNIRDSITRYTVAKSLFPCFDWKMVKRKGHGWEEYGA